MMKQTPQINLERRHSQSIFMIYNIIFLEILAQSMMNPTPQINLERRHSQSIFMIYNIISIRDFSTVYDESNSTDKSREKAFSKYLHDLQYYFSQ